VVLHTWKVVGRVVAGSCTLPDSVQQLHVQQLFTYAKPEAASAVLGSWWWAVCRPKHVELGVRIIEEIPGSVASDTFRTRMLGSTNIRFPYSRLVILLPHPYCKFLPFLCLISLIMIPFIYLPVSLFHCWRDSDVYTPLQQNPPKGAPRLIYV